MATKRPRSSFAPTDRPIQYKDIDAPGRQALGGMMRDFGRAKEKITEARGQAFRAQQAAEERTSTDTSGAAARTVKKQEHATRRFDLVEEHLTNAKVTLDTAAQRRADLARGSAARARREGASSPLRESGAGWYFEHRKALNETAARHDYPESHVVAASAVMSPLNAPENERAAVESLAKLHRENPTLSFDPKSRKALGLKGASHKYSDLTPAQASQIGSPQYRSGIKGVDERTLTGVASGGPFGNVEKAINILRGNVKPEEAINPSTSAKVWSYHNATRNATPGGAVHEEYLTRAQTALHEMPGQQTMDLFGLRHSREGILDPHGHTAEDTWMNAVSSGQRLEGVEGGRHIISPAKVVGSEKAFVGTGKSYPIRGENVSVHPSPTATAESVRHAWHNEATQRGSAILSRGTDVEVPSVLTQETSWTEARRVAGKDPEYNIRRTGTTKPWARTLRPANKGQGRLF